MCSLPIVCCLMKIYRTTVRSIYLDIYLDTLGTPSQACDKYYWTKDGHHNATGYQLMAEGVMVALRPLLDSLKAPTATANAK